MSLTAPTTQLTPKFPTSIDGTMLSAYSSCPQKFFLSFCLHLAKVGKSPDLHAGGAMAAGFEAARMAFYYHKKPEKEAVYAGLAAFTKYWGDYEAPDKHPKTFINCGYALTEYFNQYPMGSDHLDPVTLSDGRPAVEFTFALPTKVMHPETGLPVLFSGRCDLVAALRDNNGAIAVVDEKTSKGLGPRFFTQWGMRGQFYGYAYALIDAGVPVEYALVRGIGLLKTETKFCEVLVPISKHNMDKWWTATNQKIAEIVNRWKFMVERRELVAEEYREEADYEIINQQNKQSHPFWTYAFSDSCESYFGCEFKTNCLSQNPHLGYKDYDQRHWDPLAKIPDAKSVVKVANQGKVDLPEDVLNELKAKGVVE